MARGNHAMHKRCLGTKRRWSPSVPEAGKKNNTTTSMAAAVWWEGRTKCLTSGCAETTLKNTKSSKRSGTAAAAAWAHS